MNSEPIVFERTFNLPASTVWKAISDKDEMKLWYFDLPDFKAEKGTRFQFTGGEEGGKQFLHLSEVIEVIPEKKLSYSWRYDGYPGDSLLTFELFAQDRQTTLRLSHAGLETFPPLPEFAVKNFTEGWTYILHTSLKAYLEQDPTIDFIQQFSVNTTDASVYKALTTHISSWWTVSTEGSGQQVNDTFTVRFGGTYKTFVVQEAIPNEKVVWLCTAAYIDSPELQHKSEWLGTTIRWSILQEGNQSKVTLTHRGLTKALECYTLCENGWLSFTESLTKFLLTGEGTPYKN